MLASQNASWPEACLWASGSPHPPHCVKKGLIHRSFAKCRITWSFLLEKRTLAIVDYCWTFLPKMVEPGGSILAQRWYTIASSSCTSHLCRSHIRRFSFGPADMHALQPLSWLLGRHFCWVSIGSCVWKLLLLLRSQFLNLCAAARDLEQLQLSRSVTNGDHRG